MLNQPSHGGIILDNRTIVNKADHNEAFKNFINELHRTLFVLLLIKIILIL